MHALISKSIRMSSKSIWKLTKPQPWLLHHYHLLYLIHLPLLDNSKMRANTNMLIMFISIHFHPTLSLTSSKHRQPPTQLVISLSLWVTTPVAMPPLGCLCLERKGEGSKQDFFFAAASPSLSSLCQVEQGRPRHHPAPPMKNLEASLPLLFLFYPRTRHGMAIFRNLLIWPSHVATSLP
jgi:hypothetical protein